MADISAAERDHRILVTLRCIGHSTTERVVEASGLSTTEVGDGLGSLGELVRHDDGVFGGWSITDAGRAEVVRRVTAEVAEHRPAVESAYADFVDLNPRLLEVCGEWQIRRIGSTVIPNDHADLDYDLAVIDRLARIDTEVRPILELLTEVLPRFGVYGTRFARALERVDGGQYRYFTDDMESYHTIWFQLHEDLLVTLGRNRFTDG